MLASRPGWSRHAVARAVCGYITDVLPHAEPCHLPTGGFEGLNLNSLDYGSLSSKHLGDLRLRVVATALAASIV